MNYAFIDLETTGTDEYAGSIIEVGIVVTDPDLVPLTDLSLLVEPVPEHVHDADEVVVAMHEGNGLWRDLNRAREDRRLLTPIEVDTTLCAFLKPHLVDGTIALAGSGVAHFDARWIRLHLPATAKRLTYWSLDVGVVRRFLRDVCHATAAVDEAAQHAGDAKTHRALEDVYLHLAETAVYRHWLTAGAGEEQG